MVLLDQESVRSPKAMISKCDTKQPKVLTAETAKSALQFLRRMTLMFEDSRQKKGHIDMVFKRYDGRTKPEPCPENQERLRAKGKYSGKKKAKAKQEVPQASSADPVDPDVRKLLVRVAFKNSKISTVVEPEAVPKFQEAYCKLVRNNMSELKKEKKKKKAANTAKT